MIFELFRRNKSGLMPHEYYRLTEGQKVMVRACLLKEMELDKQRGGGGAVCPWANIHS